MRPRDLSLFTLCVQNSQLSLRAFNWLSKFERSIGRLEIAIRWVRKSKRSIGVLRMAMYWLSDYESGGSLNVSRQASLHSCLMPEYQPPVQSHNVDFTMSLMSTFIL